MSGPCPSILLATSLLIVGLVSTPAPALGQGPSARSPTCVAATDKLESLRAANPSIAVVYGGDHPECQQDDAFLVALALAKIDVAKQIKRAGVETRTSHFNGAIRYLEAVRNRVATGRSVQYEVFTILGQIYFDTQQYEKSIAVLNQAKMVWRRLSPKQRQDNYFIKGMAQVKLGRTSEAASSFGTARQLGHPQAARLEQAAKTK